MQATKSIDATCPECRGPLSETQTDNLFEYRCLVGHGYSARSLLESHSETQERSLWSAVVALEESAKLVDSLASQFPSAIAERLVAQAETKLRQAAAVRRILEELEPFQVE
jgi:two-component system, chemotaxis family, protein-glutamate methylesterase/glutaminase